MTYKHFAVLHLISLQDTLITSLFQWMFLKILLFIGDIKISPNLLQSFIFPQNVYISISYLDSVLEEASDFLKNQDI